MTINRTLVELKRDWMRDGFSRHYPINRTLVELKHPEVGISTLADNAINRTLVELKLKDRNATLNWIFFYQSYLSGIKTDIHEAIDTYLSELSIVP